jgi:membrane protease YdiL (CAAX protease family)
MQILVLALFLAAILTLLSDSLKQALGGAFARRPALVFALPVLLTAVFCLSAAMAGAGSLPLALVVLGYTLAPTLCAYAAGPGPMKGRPCGLDFAAVALLWLPLEFGAGATLVPRAAQGFLHSVAYGIAILLALVLFAGFRGLPGMKYNLPRRRRDFTIPLAGFLLLAPVLYLLAAPLGFIDPPHLPANPAPGAMAARYATIFAATALPEEILFRSLVQNLLMLRFGFTNSVLALAALLFGLAHLNNGGFPNWQYAILATVAGFGFGKVFQLAGSVLSSASVHATVNAVKYFFL